MRKIILLVILIVALVGVSYLKSVRQTDTRQAAYEEGKSDAIELAESNQRRADSLTQAVEDLEEMLADTLAARDSAFSTVADSLSQLIASHKDTITYLKEQISLAAATKKASARKPSRSEKERKKVDAILKYYKTRYNNLPSDLSDYERRVALTEIRIETAEKFSISERELAKIRKNAGLKY